MKRLEKEIKNQKQANHINDEPLIIENELLEDGNDSNSILKETLDLNNKNKYVRQYSDIYIAVSSIAYIFGSKS